MTRVIRSVRYTLALLAAGAAAECLAQSECPLPTDPTAPVIQQIPNPGTRPNNEVVPRAYCLTAVAGEPNTWDLTV